MGGGKPWLAVWLATLTGTACVARDPTPPQHVLDARAESRELTLTTTCAAMSLMPGIVVRVSARARIGSNVFPTAASARRVGTNGKSGATDVELLSGAHSLLTRRGKSAKPRP
jgi:hypothetical protein